MNAERILRAVGGIDERFIDEAAGFKRRRVRRRIFISAVAAALVVAMIVGGSLRNMTPRFAVATPDYPRMARYPSGPLNLIPGAMNAWRDDNVARRAAAEKIGDLSDFYRSTMGVFLSGADGGNRVYSPLNVYMALAMLAEVTDGETREELLSVLGEGDVVSLRSRAKAVWRANYKNDGVTRTTLASSLWLDDSVEFKDDAVKTLADDYFASTYRGALGSGGLDGALRSWLDRETGGLLKDAANNASFRAETILAIATTLYFEARWQHEFPKKATRPDIFHAPSGDVTADFMHRSDAMTYYWGEKFSAARLSYEGGGAMLLVLPDEGYTPEDLLRDDGALRFMSDYRSWENAAAPKVNLSMPKFDVSSEFSLTPGLRELGINRVFDEGADFSPLTDSELCLTGAEHAVRVMVDEEKTRAAAWTLFQGAGSAAPPDNEVDFVLDRPFIFAVTGGTDSVLFAGVVNDPTAG